MRFLSYNLVSLTSLIIAGSLIWADKDHWGWFLVIGAFTAVVPKSESKD